MQKILNMPKPFIPKAKPNLELSELIAEFIPSEHLETLQKSPAFVVFISNYYKLSVTDEGYNDAMFLLFKKDGVLQMRPFNGSCNPSPSKVKRDLMNKEGSVKKKGTPVLQQNIIYQTHVLDLHNAKYEAVCQRVGSVSVTRLNSDGVPYTDVGAFGINLHRGGLKNLNSEGCMTMPPIQFSEFMQILKIQIGAQPVLLNDRTIIPIVVYHNK